MLTKLIKYELYDLIKSKWIVGLFLFYLLVNYILIALGRDFKKAIISHNNISLITLTLFSVLLSANYLYNNRNFIEFVLTQPIGRSSMFSSLVISLSISIATGYSLGSLLPFYYHFGMETLYIKILILNIFLIPLFVLLGLLSALFMEDKLKGLGLSLFLWLFSTALYDGIILYLILIFSDYPIEKPILFLTLANPIDLIRLVALMETGLYEVMGFVGRWLAKYLKELWFIPSLLSLFYTFILMLIGLYTFRKKDF